MFFQKLPELLKKITKLSRKIRSKDIIGTIKSHVEKIGHGKEKKTEGEIWIPPTTWYSSKTGHSDRRDNIAEYAVYTCISNADHEEGGSECSLGISTIQAQWVKEPDAVYATEEHDIRKGPLEFTHERANNNSTWKSLLLFQFNGEPAVFLLKKRKKDGTSILSLTYFRPDKDVIRMDVPAENSDDIESMKERILLQMLSSSVFINIECCLSAEMDQMEEPFRIDFGVHEITRFAVFLSSKLTHMKAGSQKISELMKMVAPKNQGYIITPRREENFNFPSKIIQDFSLQSTRCITWKEDVLVLGCKAYLYVRCTIFKLLVVKTASLSHKPFAIGLPEIWQKSLVRNSMTGIRMSILDCICFDGKILLQLGKNMQLQPVKNRGICNAEEENFLTSSIIFVNMTCGYPVNKTFAANAIQRGDDASILVPKDVEKEYILQEDDGRKKDDSIIISKSLRLQQTPMLCFCCPSVQSDNCFSPKANSVAERSACPENDITRNVKRLWRNLEKQNENTYRAVQQNYESDVKFKESIKEVASSDGTENIKSDHNLWDMHKTEETQDEIFSTETNHDDQGVGKMATANVLCKDNCKTPVTLAKKSHGRRNIGIGVLSIHFFQNLTNSVLFLVLCLMFTYPAKANQYISKCNAVRDSVVEVTNCPKTYTEWKQRSVEKNCSLTSKDCGDLHLKYHCVLNDEKTGFVEVCAREHKIIDQKCPEFNNGIERIQAQMSTHCNSCPWAYKSTDVDKYMECFDKIKGVNDVKRTKEVTQEKARTTIFPVTESRKTDLNETGQEIRTSKRNCQIIAVVFVSLGLLVLLVIVLYVIIRTRKLKQKESFKERVEGFKLCTSKLAELEESV